MYSFLYGLKIALCITSLVTFLFQTYSKKYNTTVCMLSIVTCILFVNGLNLVGYIILCAFSKMMIFLSAKKKHKVKKVREGGFITPVYSKFDFLTTTGLLNTCDEK